MIRRPAKLVSDGNPAPGVSDGTPNPAAARRRREEDGWRTEFERQAGRKFYQDRLRLSQDRGSAVFARNERRRFTLARVQGGGSGRSLPWEPPPTRPAPQPMRGGAPTPTR